MRPVAMRTAKLIVTKIAESDKEVGHRAIYQRLQALFMTCDVVYVAHTEDAIAQAIAAAETDLVLILTASATSDPHDVAPEAVRAAGGQVTRFGMPVDPGNLLFLGTQGGRPVIGLPGCARSPALNGADWVLERVVCGLEVSDDDIAAMGVGGLLKESPARPHPREKR
jgi:molybdenum cofactor cytidylyltransferase